MIGRCSISIALTSALWTHGNACQPVENGSRHVQAGNKGINIRVSVDEKVRASICPFRQAKNKAWLKKFRAVRSQRKRSS